jgi:sugar phosphate isomerase/epimerase
LKWFIEYAQQMTQLGVTSIGGHPGILSIKNDLDFTMRKKRLHEMAVCWQRLFESIEPMGIKNIFWEPMSISREVGHTIEDAFSFQELLERVGGEHFKICLDLDHGDLQSDKDSDRDPLAWIKSFKNRIGALHLKQTTKDRRKHMSFTPSNNAVGTVDALKVIETLKDFSIDTLTMYLELGFRERNPDDKNAVIENLASVEYWRKAGARVN